MVGLRTINRTSIFTGPQHRLLDFVAAPFWNRQHRNSDQYLGHYRIHAVSWHDAWENAPLRLAQLCDGRARFACREPSLGCADHAAYRSLPRRTFLRYASGGLGSDLDAFLLD